MKSEVKITDVLKGLFSGYSFRGKVENDPEGDISIIQMKDLENNYVAIGVDLIKIDSSAIPSKYLLKPGDVLLISKGSNNYAVNFDLTVGKYVASSAFFVLRPDVKKIVPAYLSWYLNQKPVQQFLSENKAGTYVPNINKSTVEEIQVSLPDFKTQELISQIAALALKEEVILSKLSSRRKIYTNYNLLKAIES